MKPSWQAIERTMGIGWCQTLIDRGFNASAYNVALVQNDTRTIEITHPKNWMTEAELHEALHPSYMR